MSSLISSGRHCERPRTGRGLCERSRPKPGKVQRKGPRTSRRPRRGQERGPAGQLPSLSRTPGRQHLEDTVIYCAFRRTGYRCAGEGNPSPPREDLPSGSSAHKLPTTISNPKASTDISLFRKLWPSGVPGSAGEECSCYPQLTSHFIAAVCWVPDRPWARPSERPGHEPWAPCLLRPGASQPAAGPRCPAWSSPGTEGTGQRHGS